MLQEGAELGALESFVDRAQLLGPSLDLVLLECKLEGRLGVSFG
jgi:hypothetical protein